MMTVTIAIISFISAFVFALGGVGAAIILIPILVSMGIPINVAKPVGLFFNTISLAGASIHNIKNKRLDFYTGIPIIVSSFIFAILGAYTSKFIPKETILFLFVLFLLFSGTMFLLKGNSRKETYRTDRPYILLFLIGAISGLLSGMLGVGGGGIISPLMLMLKYNPKKTATITAFVVPFSSFSGFLTYWAMGSIDWHILLVASISGLLGATLGTKFMHSHLEPRTIKKILAIILLLMAVKLLLKIL